MSKFLVDPGIARAYTIDTSVYTSPEVFQEMRNFLYYTEKSPTLKDPIE